MERPLPWLALALGLCACRSRPSPQPEPPAPATTASTTSPTSSPATTGAPAASASARPAQTPAQRQALVRYQRALERGRVATRHRDFDAADKAFTEALEARPDDPRALAERGYERLLAHDGGRSAADLMKAKGHSPDAALEAQIWFNLGLLAEQDGDAETARERFARSLAENPTAAARQKLAGKSQCPISVDAHPVPLETFPGWLAAWSAVGRDDQREYADRHAASTEEEARALWGGDQCSPACVVGTWLDARWHLGYRQASGAVMVLRSVDQGHVYRCGGDPQFKTKEEQGRLWVSAENVEMVTSLCGPCDESYCPSCCNDGPWHRYDYFIAGTPPRLLVRVEQSGPKSAERDDVSVQLSGGKVVISGKGCDRTIPLP